MILKDSVMPAGSDIKKRTKTDRTQTYKYEKTKCRT